jgi:hypothetical protein
MVEFPGGGDFSYRGNVEVHWFGDEGMLRGMGGRDALPVVLKGLTLHAIAGEYAIERAVALSLPYAATKKCRLDRVIHRPSKEVFRFDPNINVEAPPLDLPAFACHGRVVTRGGAKPENRNKDQFVFIEVPGVSENVFCYWRNCTAFEDLVPRTPVCLDIEVTEKGLTGSSVRAVDETTLEAWLRGMRPQLAREFLSGRATSDFRPDYRALHYIADQVLRRTADFEQVVEAERAAGQFDEDYTAALESNVISSRFLDCGEIGSAIRTFSVAPPETRRHYRSLARSLIASRLRNAMNEAIGNVILGSSETGPKQRDSGATQGLAS